MKVRDNMKKAETLAEVCVTCRYFALDNDDLLKFYVDTSAARGKNIIESLKSYFNVLPEVFKQVLCLGHAGCGKSTMFYQLERSLNSSYNVIRFSVQDTLDMKNITFADLLCAIYQKVFEYCSPFLHDTAKLKQAYETWNSTITINREAQTSAEIGVSAEAGMGFSGKFLKLLTNLTSSLKMVAEDRTQIQTEIKRHMPMYVDLLNELIDECNQVLDKPILLMIEDLEKILNIESVTDIFVQQVGYFHKIKLNFLLTAPISLKYSSDYRAITQPNFSREFVYPMIAISDPVRKEQPNENALFDYKDNEIGRAILKKIVYARVSDGLIVDDALELAISYSGGVIRDLLQLISSAASDSKDLGKEKIDENDINDAFISLQNRFHDLLRTSAIAVIKAIYKNPYGIIDDEYSTQFFKLLKNEAIIEYNGKQWKGIHPAVLKCLENSGETFMITVS